MALADLLRHPLLALAEPMAGLLERLARVRGGNRRHAAGRTGERLAWFHLRRNGYIVVARRWRAPNLDGEVDLIAWHGETLCFVEVKTRTRDDRYSPSYAIDQAKQKELRRMASAYVQSLPWRDGECAAPNVRFDTVSVLLDGKPFRIECNPGSF